MNIPKDWTFKNADVAAEFDRHVREQLPWYDLATGVITHVARHYIPDGGTVYDIGASTGNLGRSMRDIIESRHVNFIPIDSSEYMRGEYSGIGELIIADATQFPFQVFDLAVCFLTLVFISVPERQRLISKLRFLNRPGGAIVVFERMEPLSGYPSIIMSRLALAGKLASGVDSKQIIDKELSLSGIQRPLNRNELGDDAKEIFRFGDFAGWIIESPIIK